MPSIINYVNNKSKIFLIILFFFCKNSNIAIHSIVSHKKIGRLSSLLLYPERKSIKSDLFFLKRTVFTSHLMEKKRLHPYFFTQFRFLTEKNNFNDNNTDYDYNDIKKPFSTTTTSRKRTSKAIKNDTKIIIERPKKSSSTSLKGKKTASKKPGSLTAIKKEKTESKDGEKKK